MDAKRLKGMPVVSIEGGEQLGTVHDLLFSIDDRGIQAFSVRSGGLIGGTTNVVERGDVRSIGPDAVMVQSRAVLQGEDTEHRYRQYPSLGEISSLKVVSEEGSRIGSVASVLIDEQTGAITGLEIVRAGLTGPFRSNISVPIDAVISIGRDAVVIPERVANPPAEGAQPETAPGQEESQG